jgi:hypothetical protein
MSYHFWKVLFRGMVIADIMMVLGFSVFLYFNGGSGVGGEYWVQFRIISVVTLCCLVGTGYVKSIYLTVHGRARLRNLDRVHPMGNGRRRTG